MFKKSLLLSLLVIAGCDQKFDDRKASSLINEQIGRGCFYVALKDTSDIHFNTITRVYDKETKTIKESDVREYFSLSKGPYYEKQHHQLTALEGVGLVDKIGTHVLTNGKGEFLTDIKDAPSALTPTAKIAGLQYRLTNIGNGYIRQDPESHGVNMCVGYLRVKDIQLPQTESGGLPERMSVSYTVEVRDTPNWLNDERVAKEFPVIKETLQTTNGMTGQAIFVKTSDGYIIEK